MSVDLPAPFLRAAQAALPGCRHRLTLSSARTPEETLETARTHSTPVGRTELIASASRGSAQSFKNLADSALADRRAHRRRETMAESRRYVLAAVVAERASARRFSSAPSG